MSKKLSAKVSKARPTPLREPALISAVPFRAINSKDGLGARVSGTDYIGQVHVLTETALGSLITTISMHPNSLTSRARLYSQMYSRFLFHKFVMHYVPNVSAVTPGSMVFAVSVDADQQYSDTDPGLITTLMANANNVMSSVSARLSYSAKIDLKRPMCYCASHLAGGVTAIASAVETSQHDFSQGNFYIAWAGEPPAADLIAGSLYLTYEIEFRDPTLETPVSMPIDQTTFASTSLNEIPFGMVFADPASGSLKSLFELTNVPGGEINPNGIWSVSGFRVTPDSDGDHSVEIPPGRTFSGQVSVSCNARLSNVMMEAPGTLPDWLNTALTVVGKVCRFAANILDPESEPYSIGDSSLHTGAYGVDTYDANAYTHKVALTTVAPVAGTAYDYAQFHFCCPFDIRNSTNEILRWAPMIKVILPSGMIQGDLVLQAPLVEFQNVHTGLCGEDDTDRITLRGGILKVRSLKPSRKCLLRDCMQEFWAVRKIEKSKVPLPDSVCPVKTSARIVLPVPGSSTR